MHCVEVTSEERALEKLAPGHQKVNWLWTFWHVQMSATDLINRRARAAVISLTDFIHG